MKKSDNKNNKKSFRIKNILCLAIAVTAMFLGYDNFDSIEKNFGTNVKKTVYMAYESIIGYKDLDTYQNTDNDYIIEPSGNLDIYYFYVGQAECILLTNSGESMLIDAGNNEDGELIVSKLQKMNIEKLNYVVGTHAHEDHIGGLDDIINNFEVSKVFMPKKSNNTKTYEDVLKAVSKAKLKVTVPKIGDIFYLGNAKCEIMSIDNESNNLNENSIVIEVTYGTKKFLFTGDAEVTNEEKRDWNDIDVLTVAHHGSSSSTSKEFLNKTKPEYAIISVGKNNDYGHPHKETINKLKNITVYRTDRDGTIFLSCDGENIEFKKLNINLDGNN